MKIPTIVFASGIMIVWLTLFGAAISFVRRLWREGDRPVAVFVVCSVTGLMLAIAGVLMEMLGLS